MWIKVSPFSPDPPGSKFWRGCLSPMPAPFTIRRATRLKSYAHKSGAGHAERTPRGASQASERPPRPAGPASHTPRRMAGQEDPPGSADQQGAAPLPPQKPPRGVLRASLQLAQSRCAGMETHRAARQGDRAADTLARMNRKPVRPANAVPSARLRVELPYSKYRASHQLL